MSGFIFEGANIVEKTKKDKLLEMETQMKIDNWGSSIGVIHIYVPKNMYDVMGSKVIEMSDELKGIKNPKITTTKVKNSICWSVCNKLNFLTNQPVNNAVNPLISPIMDYIRDFFKKFAGMYIHHYSSVPGKKGHNWNLMLQRIIGYNGSIFLLQNTVKSHFSKASREFYFHNQDDGKPFVLKVFTSYSKTDEKGEAYSPVGANVEKVLLEYAEDMLEDGTVHDAKLAYNLWDDGGHCPYGRIPLMGNANSNNYLMHHPEDSKEIPAFGSNPHVPSIPEANRLFLVNHCHQYIGSLLALIDYCHDFLDSSGDRTAEGYSTSSAEIRETIWGWIKKLKIQTSAGSNMFYVVKRVLTAPWVDVSENRTEKELAQANVVDAAGAGGEIVTLFNDDDMEKTLSNMAYLRDTLFDNDGSYIFFYPGFLFIDDEDVGGQTGLDKFKAKLIGEDQSALRCCYYRGADEVLVPGDSSNTTIQYENLGDLKGDKSPLYVRLTGVNKKANGKGINKMLKATYKDFFIRDPAEEIYKGGRKAIVDSNKYEPSGDSFQEKLFSHIPDPAFGPNFVRDCGSSDALVESILGYSQFPFMGDKTAGKRARQAIFSAIMDPATGVENDPLLFHEYFSIPRTKGNIIYNKNTINKPKVVLPYMYVWWPNAGEETGELQLKGIIFIQLELDFITREDLNDYKKIMQTKFPHLKDEKKIPEINRILANKVTFLVYKNPDNDSPFSLETCNDDIANHNSDNAVKFNFTQISKTPGVSSMCTLLMEYEKKNIPNLVDFFQTGNPIVYSDQSWATCMYEVGYLISHSVLDLHACTDANDDIYGDPFLDQYTDNVLMKWCGKNDNKGSTIAKQDDFEDLRDLNQDEHYFSAHQFAFMFGTTYKTFGDKFRYVDSHIYGIPMETCDTFLVKVSTVGGVFGLYTHSDELLCFGPIVVLASAASEEEEVASAMVVEGGIKGELISQMKNIFKQIGNVTASFGYIDFDDVSMYDLDSWNSFLLEKPILYKSGIRIIPQEFLYKLHFALALLILKVYNIQNDLQVSKRIRLIGGGMAIIDENKTMVAKLETWVDTFKNAFGEGGAATQQKPLVYDHYLDSLLSILWYNYEPIDINYGSKAKPKDMFNFHQGLKQSNEAISKNLNDLYQYVKSQLQMYITSVELKGGAAIKIPGADGFDYNKLEDVLGLNLSDSMLMYDLFDPLVPSNIPRHKSQFISLQTFVRQQPKLVAVGGGYTHKVKTTTAEILDANQLVGEEKVGKISIPGLSNDRFFRIPYNLTDNTGASYDYHYDKSNLISYRESIMYDEVNDFVIFMYFIESITVGESVRNNTIVKKIKSLAIMMYKLLKKINMPDYGSTSASGSSGDSGETKSSPPVVGSTTNTENGVFPDLLRDMRDLLKEKASIDRTIDVLKIPETQSLNSDRHPLISVDKLIKKFVFRAEKNNMKYRPDVETVRIILLKKLKTNILHIIELIGIKMYHVIKQIVPKKDDGIDIWINLTDEWHSKHSQDQGIGFHDVTLPGESVVLRAINNAHYNHTTPISLYMCMLRNSIITEPTIVTEKTLRKVQTWAESIKVLPFNYTINLESEFNIRDIGPSLSQIRGNQEKTMGKLSAQSGEIEAHVSEINEQVARKESEVEELKKSLMAEKREKMELIFAKGVAMKLETIKELLMEEKEQLMEAKRQLTEEFNDEHGIDIGFKKLTELSDQDQIIIFVDCVGDIYFYTNGKTFGSISELGKDQLATTKMTEKVLQLNRKLKSISNFGVNFLKLGLTENNDNTNNQQCPLCKLQKNRSDSSIVDKKKNVLTDAEGIVTNSYFLCINCGFTQKYLHNDSFDDESINKEVKLLDERGKFSEEKTKKLIKTNNPNKLQLTINTLLRRDIEITPTQLIKLALFIKKEEEQQKIESTSSTATASSTSSTEPAAPSKEQTPLLQTVIGAAKKEAKSAEAAATAKGGSRKIRRKKKPKLSRRKAKNKKLKLTIKIRKPRKRKNTRKSKY